MQALPPRGLLPGNTEPAEVLVDRGLVFGATADGVDVLDPQQQPPAALARHFVVEQRRIRVSEVKMAVRARGKTQDAGMHEFRLAGTPG